MMERIVIEVHSQAEKEALIDELEGWGLLRTRRAKSLWYGFVREV